MSRTSRILLGVIAMALAGCAGGPPPQYSESSQSRAIDTDIDATHVVGPTTTSPARTEPDPSMAQAPWRDEETIDHLNTLRDQREQ
jgi:hypothetical protein